MTAIDGLSILAHIQPSCWMTAFLYKKESSGKGGAEKQFAGILNNTQMAQ
jgi:hypothetical protein